MLTPPNYRAEMVRWRALVAMLLVVAAACTDDSPVSEPASSSTVAATEQAVAPERIVMSIELEHTEGPAGKPIQGLLVFENPGPAVDVLHQGCQPKWTVQLTAAASTAQPVFTMECITAPLTIPSGRSELPFELATTHPMCAQDESGAIGIPQCVDNRPPALPHGTYQAQLFTYGGALGGPPPDPVTVTLTAWGR
jgi:hypothetical protein